MALSAGLGRGGTPPAKLEVDATVTFEQVDGGWKVVSSALKVVGTVPGLDAAGFQSAAEAAKDGCPISQMMKGNVTLSVEATLG
jgi:osmotically inducible protein OsmC